MRNLPQIFRLEAKFNMASVVFSINIRRRKTIFSPSIVRREKNSPKLLVWMLGVVSQLSMIVKVGKSGLIKVFSSVLSSDFVEDLLHDFLP